MSELVSILSEQESENELQIDNPDNRLAIPLLSLRRDDERSESIEEGESKYILAELAL
jgi:hypothetical protein